MNATPSPLPTTNECIDTAAPATRAALTDEQLLSLSRERPPTYGRLPTVTRSDEYGSWPACAACGAALFSDSDQRHIDECRVLRPRVVNAHRAQHQRALAALLQDDLDEETEA